MQAQATQTNEIFSREAAAGYRREVIENAQVILVGCGALGDAIAELVALVGYRNVIFIDMDFYESSNRPRARFFSEGGSKAECVARGAARMCTSPSSNYRYASCMVQHLGDAIFAGDNIIVLSAVDSQPARLWLTQRCRLLSIALLEGGFRGERWNLSSFLNRSHDEPCWACGQSEIEEARIFSCDAYAKAVEEQGLIPATAPGAMSLASLQVSVMTKLLHGEESALANSTLFADLGRGFVQLMKRERDPNCRVDHRLMSEYVQLRCGPVNTVDELLDELSCIVDEPVVSLPSSFIRAAPCRSCRRCALVNQPEWALSGPPLCVACGGGYPRTDELPEQHGSLSRATSASIAHTTLEQLGLGPSLRLFVHGRDEEIAVALSGSAEDYLTKAGEEDG